MPEADLLGVNELHTGLCRSLVQLASPGWSNEVDDGRHGCCTSLLYLHGLALKDGEVVGRTWSREVRILTIMHLAWQEAFDRRGYLPSFCELTEQTEHTVVRAAVLALNRQRQLSGPNLKYAAMRPMQS
jgi:hypothetical protein